MKKYEYLYKYGISVWNDPTYWRIFEVSFFRCQMRCQILEQTTHGSGGVTIPRGVQENPVCGMCYSLADKVVICQGLDSMILDVYSSLNDFVILCLYFAGNRETIVCNHIRIYKFHSWKDSSLHEIVKFWLTKRGKIFPCNKIIIQRLIL